ncbi:MAG: hypothetical protein AAF696_21545 [Bacteroidota bacterium]
MKNLLISLLLLLLTFSFGVAQESEKEKEEEQTIKIETYEVKTSKKERLKLKLKDGAKPDVYINGKKYDPEIIDLIDPDNIESINILKGDKAIEEYNAPNGVVVITSKKEKTVVLDSGKTTIKIQSSDDVDPKIIINGEEADRATLKKLSPKKIKTIEVVKGDKAIEQYKAPNGVIIIKTKKGNR